MTFSERINAYEKLMRLDKPIGILLLLWPTLWALWFAAYGHVDAMTALIFVIGTVLMRSAGCVVNDLADRKFDAHVERTKNRPLAVGSVSVKEALILAAALALLAFGLVLFLNPLTVKLSFVALIVAAIYPFMKRFFPMPQAWLGVAFSFGIPMAYAAYREEVPPVAWCMMLANLFWVIAYDTAYAMTDRDDDLKLGLKSSAIFFGRFDVAAVMLCHALFLIGMSVVGYRSHMSIYFYAGVLVAAATVVRQFFLIKNREREQCFKAFLNNNYTGAAIFIGTMLDFVL